MTIKSRTRIVLGVISAIGLVTVALIQYQPWRTLGGEDAGAAGRLVVAGRIVDAATNRTVAGAELTLAGRTEAYVSEDNGNFRIEVPRGSGDVVVRLRVSKEGYIPIDRSVTAPAENVIILIRRAR